MCAEAENDICGPSPPPLDLAFDGNWPARSSCFEGAVSLAEIPAVPFVIGQKDGQMVRESIPWDTHQFTTWLN